MLHVSLDWTLPVESVIILIRFVNCTPDVVNAQGWLFKRRAGCLNGVKRDAEWVKKTRRDDVINRVFPLRKKTDY